MLIKGDYEENRQVTHWEKYLQYIHDKGLVPRICKVNNKSINNPIQRQENKYFRKLIVQKAISTQEGA